MFRVTTYYQEDWNKMNTVSRQVDRLWTDHFMYTRNVIISSLGSLNDLPTVVDRLLANQDSIGGLLEDYYDAADVAAYVSLLKTHISIAGELVTAVKAAQDTTEIMARWQANGGEIVDWMDDHNPSYWPADQLQLIWDSHLNHTFNEMTNRAAEAWSADIMSVDDGMDTMMVWSKRFSQGLIYQYPERYCMG